MTFIAGAYTATYGGDAIGITEQGFTIEETTDKDLVVGDNLGASVQDGAYLGGQRFISCVLEEFDLEAVLESIWPYRVAVEPASTDITFHGRIGQVGRMDVASSIAQVLELTVANTIAADQTTADENNVPQKLTANRAILAAGFPINLLFSSRVRRIPMRWRLYPFVTSQFGADEDVWYINNLP